MDAIVDTDFARCTRTGKSTNGGTQLTSSRAGQHADRFAMSSGEVECSGVVKGACEAVGML